MVFAFLFFFRLHDVNAGKLSRGELDDCIVPCTPPRMPGVDQEIRYLPIFNGCTVILFPVSPNKNSKKKELGSCNEAFIKHHKLQVSAHRK